jgi:hypothetical protein
MRLGGLGCWSLFSPLLTADLLEDPITRELTTSHFPVEQLGLWLSASLSLYWIDFCEHLSPALVLPVGSHEICCGAQQGPI